MEVPNQANKWPRCWFRWIASHFPLWSLDSILFRESCNCPRWDYVQLFISESCNHECDNIIVSTFPSAFRWENICAYVYCPQWIPVFNIITGLSLALCLRSDMICDLCCVLLLWTLLIWWLMYAWSGYSEKERENTHGLLILKIFKDLFLLFTSCYMTFGQVIYIRFLIDKIHIILTCSTWILTFFWRSNKKYTGMFYKIKRDYTNVSIEYFGRRKEGRKDTVRESAAWSVNSSDSSHFSKMAASIIHENQLLEENGIAYFCISTQWTIVCSFKLSF